MECLSKGIPVICKEIRGNKDLITNAFNGYFIKSYKEVPNKIFYLNLNKTVFNKMRANAIKSITKNFSNKNINKKIFKIIEKKLDSLIMEHKLIKLKLTTRKLKLSDFKQFKKLFYLTFKKKKKLVMIFLNGDTSVTNILFAMACLIHQN